MFLVRAGAGSSGFLILASLGVRCEAVLYEEVRPEVLLKKNLRM